MAVVKQRLQRFNGSSYDTVHLETSESQIVADYNTYAPISIKGHGIGSPASFLGGPGQTTYPSDLNSLPQTSIRVERWPAPDAAGIPDNVPTYTNASGDAVKYVYGVVLTVPDAYGGAGFQIARVLAGITVHHIFIRSGNTANGTTYWSTWAQLT